MYTVEKSAIYKLKLDNRHIAKQEKLYYKAEETATT